MLHALASLHPYVLLVVLSEDGKLAGMAADIGVHVATRFRKTSFGMPYLRDVHEWLQDNTAAPFVGFMNADVVFGPSMIPALQAVLHSVQAGQLTDRIFVAGRRHNVGMPLPLPQNSSWALPQGATAEQTREFVDLLSPKSTPFLTGSCDLFISTRHAWNWTAAPDFVAGRIGYDNWMLQYAYRDQMDWLDLEGCVMPLHVTGSGGDRASAHAQVQEHRITLVAMRGYVGSIAMGKTDVANWRLHCPGRDAAKTAGELKLVPGKHKKRAGARGPPWTGLYYEGHVDPMFPGQRLHCSTAAAPGERMAEHGCKYKPDNGGRIQGSLHGTSV
jgi:hypothetical protein